MEVIKQCKKSALASVVGAFIVSGCTVMGSGSGTPDSSNAGISLRDSIDMQQIDAVVTSCKSQILENDLLMNRIYLAFSDNDEKEGYKAASLTNKSILNNRIKAKVEPILDEIIKSGGYDESTPIYFWKYGRIESYDEKTGMAKINFTREKYGSGGWPNHYTLFGKLGNYGIGMPDSFFKVGSLLSDKSSGKFGAFVFQIDEGPLYKAQSNNRYTRKAQKKLLRRRDVKENGSGLIKLPSEAVYTLKLEEPGAKGYDINYGGLRYLFRMHPKSCLLGGYESIRNNERMNLILDIDKIYVYSGGGNDFSESDLIYSTDL